MLYEDIWQKLQGDYYLLGIYPYYDYKMIIYQAAPKIERPKARPIPMFAQ